MKINREKITKKLNVEKILHFFACLCLLLPWFSWNPGVMGYCFGFDFALFLSVPLLVTGVYLWSEPAGRGFGILAGFCAAAVVAVAVLAIGCWQNLFNMTGQWKFMLKPVLPGYWLSLAMYTALFAAVQIKIFKNKKSFTGEEAHHG